MRKEQLPQLEARRHAQTRGARVVARQRRVGARQAGWIGVAFAEPDVCARRRQGGLGNIHLAGVRAVAPFGEREEGDGVIDVRDAAVGCVFVVVGKVCVEIGGKGGVADARFAKGCRLRVPAARGEVEGGEEGDGAAEAVADEDEAVGWVSGAC